MEEKPVITPNPGRYRILFYTSASTEDLNTLTAVQDSWRKRQDACERENALKYVGCCR